MGDSSKRQEREQSPAPVHRHHAAASAVSKGSSPWSLLPSRRADLEACSAKKFGILEEASRGPCVTLTGGPLVSCTVAAAPISRASHGWHAPSSLHRAMLCTDTIPKAVSSFSSTSVRCSEFVPAPQRGSAFRAPCSSDDSSYLLEGVSECIQPWSVLDF